MIKLDLKPKNETVRQFGWVALFGFPLAGLALTQWPGSLPINTLWVLVGLGVACGLAAVANVPVILRPIYLAMTLLAFPIGLMISTVLLSTIYPARVPEAEQQARIARGGVAGASAQFLDLESSARLNDDARAYAVPVGAAAGEEGLFWLPVHHLFSES